MRNDPRIEWPSSDDASADRAFAHHPLTRQLILERVKVGVSRYMPPEMLHELRLYPEPTIASMGDGMAYSLEAVLLGRQTREEVEESRVDEVANEEEDPVETRTWQTKHVPRTWWDHAKSTFVQWTCRRHDREYERFNREWALSRFWLRLPNRVRFDTDLLLLEVVNVQHVRKITLRQHVTVKRHWHTCPHLAAGPREPHYAFLEDRPQMRTERRKGQ